MKKQLLLAAVLGLSLLIFSGCTGGKTNGDISISAVRPQEDISANDAEQQEEMPREDPVQADFVVFWSSGATVDENTEQLCRAAVNYCEASTGHRPGVVRLDSEDEEGIILQLYDDMEDHTATCAWYCIDPVTMEGSDLITGGEIAFYSYMDKEMIKT